jgi:hypothetical protein
MYNRARVTGEHSRLKKYCQKITQIQIPKTRPEEDHPQQQTLNSPRYFTKQ